jgi:hypothetical protein
MTTLAIGFVLIALLVGLVLLGLQIAYALFAVGFLGIWIIRGNIDLAFRMMELTAYSGIADYLFATIPLFVLMGLLVSVSNVGRDTFEVAEELLRRVLCGLGVAGNDAPWLSPGLCRRDCRRQFGAGYADPAEPAFDHLWRAGRGVDWRHVYRGPDPRHAACHRICRHVDGHFRAFPRLRLHRPPSGPRQAIGP